MRLTKKHIIRAVWTVSTACFLLSGNILGTIGAINQFTEISTVFDSSNCTKDDFEQDGFCELSCTSASKQLYEWHWIYYIDIPSENATLYEDVNISEILVNNTSFTQISLKLTNYSAGYYRCWYHYIELNDSGAFNNFVSNDFKIDHEEKGVSLACNTTNQCLSLEASCVNSTCQCQYPFLYPLLYTESQTAVACLKGVGPFRPCNTDQQCTTTGDNYQCINDICDCSPNSTYTYVGEINEYLCLLPAYIEQSCQFNEECTLAHYHAWCYENACSCTDDYLYNSTLDLCINFTSYTPDVYPETVDNDSGLTFGEIVGFSLGTAALITIVMAIVVFCVTRR